MIQLLTSQYVEPMPSEMFDKFRKHLPKDIKKQVEARHAELQKLQKEREKEQEIRLSEILDSEILMRFAYVPFVIAALAWDYADTVCEMASLLKIHEVKPLSRAIYQLKRDYERLRAEYIDVNHQKSEENNMYVFEDAVNDVFNLYLANVGFDLKREYPQLSEDYVLFIKAVYQCHIVLQSIYKYVEIITKKVECIVERNVGDILPKELRKLDTLIVEYIGNKPISEWLEKQQNVYVKTLANRMLEIELNESKDG